MDLIHLGIDRDRWRTVVSAVKKTLVSIPFGNFLITRGVFSFSRETLHYGVSQSVSQSGQKRQTVKACLNYNPCHLSSILFCMQYSLTQ